MAERRLGRGLDFFLSGSEGPPAPESGEVVQQLALDSLVPNPHQPRRTFSDQELQELAASIASSGILQPLVVRKVGDQHQIVAGERRWRAAKIAGLETVPALVREISDEQSAVLGLVENLHREDLNPIEKAQAFKRLQQMASASQEEVAKQVGLDRSTVANLVRLLELPSQIQEHVSRGTLSMSHARALLAAPKDSVRIQLAELAIRDRLSVRQIESLAQAAKEGSAPAESKEDGSKENAGGKKPTDKGRPLWLKEIEDNLQDSLDVSVKVNYGKRKSRITIECSGRDEFERIYELLRAASQDD